MATTEFIFILLSGVVIGMLLSMSLRWMGRKLLSGNQHEKGGGIDRVKEISDEIHLRYKKEV